MGKKLIEVALPLEAINREAAREKSIRHGHPSTLHLWWARRPLAACRAVLFSQLVDDPSAHPEEFPTDEAQEAERQRLFRIIEDLVKWENSNNEVVLERARAEIRKSLGDDPPPILDPFAGGGSIPLEAQRLGLKAIASDLNPVAVLINKALIEIPPKWAGHPPVHPRDESRLDAQTWTGAQGLAEDVRYYGEWVCDEAKRRLGDLYPSALLPDGSTATAIAWVWARTVVCPNPACMARAPLVRSFWLGKKPGKRAWIEPQIRGREVDFNIGGPEGNGPLLPGTVDRSGAQCLVCGEVIPFSHVRAEGLGGRLGTKLLAVVAEGRRKRVYLPPTSAHERSAAVAAPSDVPQSSLPEKALGFRVQAYGMRRHADLFTNRQLVTLTTFSELVGEASATAVKDAERSGLGRQEAEDYGKAVAVYLSFLVSKLADYGSSLCTWRSDPKNEGIGHVFARQTIQMVWDFAEANPFSRSSGNALSALGWICNAIRELPASTRGAEGRVLQRSAMDMSGLGTVILSTDPPYYDNIGYADLADFFYIWHRRTLQGILPEQVRTMLTPKSEELVANPSRFDGSRSSADKYFEDGFLRSFTSARKVQSDDVPLTLFYAFKQAEKSGDSGGIASTGWETMLEGVIQAGLMVTATWPVRTELSNRPRGAGSNALASSVVLACRKRSESAGVTDRRGFLKTLREDLPGALGEMQQGSIAPVDLAQSAIGPGMAVFSHFAKVLEPSGDAMGSNRTHAHQSSSRRSSD